MVEESGKFCQNRMSAILGAEIVITIRE